MRILNDEQAQLLKAERAALSDLRVALARFGASAEDADTLTHSIEQLDELFLLVVVGEFNAGKSALINALLGQKLLNEGVTPTTTLINLLKYGEVVSRAVVDENQHILTLPSSFLAEVSVVDTPGTNAIMRAHEAITTRFVPRSDLVLFVTSADRPFTESERAFLERIRDWGKKVVIIINKTDILQDEGELAEIRSFVADNARALLGVTPEIYPLSARLALRAKLGEPELWQRSRFEALEQYIRSTLDEKARLRLKFLNPLGVGAYLTKRYLYTTTERLDVLKTDVAMLDDVDAQLTVYRADMERDCRYRMADIDNILYGMVERGNAFFDDTLRLGRILDLLSKERIQREFTHTVVADVPQQIERKVNELIDWLVEADLRQWQAVNNHLAEQRRGYRDRIVGEAGSDGFRYDRDRLIQSVGNEAQRVVDSYDKTREAAKMADEAQMAVAAAAALEIGALGLGALLVTLATTLSADVTGVLVSGLVAALGLFVIPARRRQAQAEMTAKVSALREKLSRALRSQFDQEMQHSVRHISEAIAPYTRFVRAEQGRLTDMQTTLQQIKNELDRLRVAADEIA